MQEREFNSCGNLVKVRDAGSASRITNALTVSSGISAPTPSRGWSSAAPVSRYCMGGAVGANKGTLISEECYEVNEASGRACEGDNG